MPKLLILLKWIDDNLLKLLIVGFIYLVPLYPKFPLRFIDYTYIAIRLEDLYTVGLVFVFIIQLMRKKVKLNRNFLVLILAFWAAVMLSYLWGAFIQKTVIYKQLGFLNAIRRIEYSIVFFVVASSIRSRRDFLFYLYSIIVTLGLVGLYGIGQKFLGFPAVQTMNPEFAKGHILYLTPEARVSSSFAGHYDLAAYLVFFLPLVLGVYFWRRNLAYFFLFVISLMTLTLTASRSSLVAYLGSIICYLIFIKKFKALVVVLALSIIFTLLSTNLSSRIAQSLRVKQIYINEKTGKVVIPQKMSAKELPSGNLFVELNRPVEKTSAQTEKLLKQSILNDIRDEAKKSGIKLTASEEAQMLATMSADLKPVSTIISDISFATRIQVEWPRAFKAFLTNPILGKGPSTITESTDNDYLRWLGEFGILATAIFLYFFYSLTRFVLNKVPSKGDEKYLLYGFIFGLFGLLINAAYIDVFEASKVAFTFWTITGTLVGYLSLEQKINS